MIALLLQEAAVALVYFAPRRSQRVRLAAGAPAEPEETDYKPSAGKEGR